MADLKLYDCLSDPWSAAMAYDTYKPEGSSYILVYDLGGSSLEVSVVLRDQGLKEVISSRHINFGGRNFDERIVDYLLDLPQHAKNMSSKVTKDTLAMRKLRSAAEKAKIQLSSELITEIPVTFDNVNVVFHNLTRAKFEQLNQDLFDESIECTKQVLEDAGIETTDVEYLLLIGGSSHIPKIRQLVEEHVGRAAAKGTSPEEAVVVGAARYVQWRNRRDYDCVLTLPERHLLNTGIETSGGVMTKMITRMHQLPTGVTRVFSTVQDNQSKVEIQIFEGLRSLTEGNHFLGTLELTGISPAPRGVPEIEVTFQMRDDRQLRVSALDRDSGRFSSTLLRVNEVSEEEAYSLILEIEEEYMKTPNPTPNDEHSEYGLVRHSSPTNERTGIVIHDEL